MFKVNDTVRILTGEFAGRVGVVEAVIANPGKFDIDLFDDIEPKPFARILVLYRPWGIEAAEEKTITKEVELDNLELVK